MAYTGTGSLFLTRILPVLGSQNADRTPRTVTEKSVVIAGANDGRSPENARDALATHTAGH